jgi:hypothetical protein
MLTADGRLLVKEILRQDKNAAKGLRMLVGC